MFGIIKEKTGSLKTKSKVCKRLVKEPQEVRLAKNNLEVQEQKEDEFGRFDHGLTG